MNYLEIYLRLEGYDWSYNEREIRERFNHPYGKCVDCYAHRADCRHFLIEDKGTNIAEAVSQFRETAAALRRSNAQIDGCVLLTKGIRSFYGNRYKRVNGMLCGSNGRRIRIGVLFIEVIYYSEIEREAERRRRRRV